MSRIIKTSMMMFALYQTVAARYNVTSYSTNNSSFVWEQKIEKPELTFEVKACSGKTVVAMRKEQLLFFNTIIHKTSTVTFKLKKKIINKVTIQEVVNHDCKDYIKLKMTWIGSEVAVWNIHGSKWEKLLSYQEDEGLVNQVSTIRFRSTETADWKVYYYDHRPVRIREICIKF